MSTPTSAPPSATESPQPQSQPRRRSHHGCWTCKQKRRRCDNTRPECQNCKRLGLQCEGYEVRLRWGTGIASRGRFTGADKPLEESIPPRPKGRRRDLERKRKQELPDQEQSQAQGHGMGQVVGTAVGLFSLQPIACVCFAPGCYVNAVQAQTYFRLPWRDPGLCRGRKMRFCSRNVRRIRFLLRQLLF